MHLVGIFILIVAIGVFFGVGDSRQIAANAFGCLVTLLIIGGVIFAIGSIINRFSEKKSNSSEEIPSFDDSSSSSPSPSADATIPPQNSNDLAEAAFAEKRYVDAFSIYARMKRHGGALGLDRMAWMYASGNGVPQNSAKAFDLYRRAAVLGDSNAQLNLGTYYGSGEATPQDYLKAYVWSTIAAARGEEGAAQNRDNYEQSLSHQQLAFGQDIAEKCMKRSMALCDRDFSIPDPSATDAN